MIDKISKKIEAVNSNLEVLPKNNKKNREKFFKYLNDSIEEFKGLLKEAEAELIVRYDEVASKYKDLSYTLDDVTIEYDALKLSDVRVPSYEKMNLDYLFYKLDNVSNNLEEVNKILIRMIDIFKYAGINLTDKDFNYSEATQIYVANLLNGSENIQDTFNELYWKYSDIIIQLELNIKYLYLKNESKINNFYKEKYNSFDFHGYMKHHRDLINQNDKTCQGSIRFIYDLFMSREYEVNDFMAENRVQEMLSNVLVDPGNERNYDNLLKLRRTLSEYKGYLKFEYMIKDFKELFAHKEEYKELYSNKLKEIATQEKALFGLNSKINKKGLFKPSKSAVANSKIERNKIIENLRVLYGELDDLKIKEFINKYVNPENNYFEILKFITYNFYYFVNLLKMNNDDVSVESIDSKMLELEQFIYDYDIDILDNISISEEKNIVNIIKDMYVLNDMNLDEDKLDASRLDALIDNVNKLLIYYDIYFLQINLKDFEFLLNVNSLVYNKK